ncbi:MAG: hypothetical protein ACREPR_25490 [Brasilonema sp.]
MITINAQILPLSQTEANRIRELATIALSDAECMVELSDAECMDIVGGYSGGGTFNGGQYSYGPGYSETVVNGVVYRYEWKK